MLVHLMFDGDGVCVRARARVCVCSSEIVLACMWSLYGELYVCIIMYAYVSFSFLLDFLWAVLSYCLCIFSL